MIQSRDALARASEKLQEDEVSFSASPVKRAITNLFAGCLSGTLYKQKSASEIAALYEVEIGKQIEEFDKNRKKKFRSTPYFPINETVKRRLSKSVSNEQSVLYLNEVLFR